MLSNRSAAAKALLLLTLVSVSPALAQDALTAQALVEKQQVFVGEPFLFQIRIDGSDSPAEPDLSGLAALDVQSLGGSQNSSESVTIINGKMSRVTQRGYVWNYRLTASKAGSVTIPSITVTAGGQTTPTQPVNIRVVPPQESEDFKIRVSLSDANVYAGQPVTMTITWYVGQNVRNFAWNVPAFDDSRFEFADIRVQVDPDRHVRIPVGSTELIAEKGRGTLDGRDFITVTAKKILTPKQPGSYVLPRVTVSGQMLRGSRGRRSPFDDFFDDGFFGIGRQPVVESFVVPSNEPALQVRALPGAGRPANFAGLVGDFRIAAKASPTEINVGDPITLTVEISGPSYLGNVELPPLENHLNLARDFKIPPDRAAGVVQNRAKRFTQTLRATHAGVAAIPPLELAYFNPQSGTYEIARTAPIPLQVRGTRIVTASDAEGGAASPVTRSEIESSEGGIAYNYEGEDVLVNRAYGPAAWIRHPAWAASLGVPPAIYLSLLAWTLYGRWKESDPAARRSRQAFKSLTGKMGKLQPANTDEFYAAVLEALRQYLGAKLGLAPGALTFRDVQGPLAIRGVEEPLVLEVKRLFDRTEAGRYAGAAYGDEDPASLTGSVLATVERLEGKLA